VGIVLGIVSGFADKLWRDDAGRLMARAGALSVVAWVLGMGSRFAFAYYAYHSGGPAIARFSASHHITGAQIWTTALVAMAFGQVLARVAVLQARRIRAASSPAAIRSGLPARIPLGFHGNWIPDQ
jgi:carotenoid cleavage dioxygenase-like enzyme